MNETMYTKRMMIMLILSLVVFSPPLVLSCDEKERERKEK